MEEQIKAITEPTLEELNKIRNEGFRPGVVACVIHNKKILMFFKEEYKLWMLPQGGINNKEKIADALSRNLIEELGAEFVTGLDFKNIIYAGLDRMEFKPGRHEMAELKDDSGKDIQMIGKDYIFCVITAPTEKIDLSKTVYDENFWMSFREAYFIADRMYQKGKRRITIKILNTLQTLGLIE